MHLTPHGDPPLYFTFPGLETFGVAHATTSRHCPGIAPFTEPIVAGAVRGPFGVDVVPVLAGAGLASARIAYVRQVHGADVAEAPSSGGFVGDADILATGERGVPLAIFTADCLAIVLVDLDARALGLAHVGWRGTTRGAAQAAVAALVARGARPERIRAAISPSIGPCCYEVDEPVMSAFAAAYGAASKRWFTPSGEGHARLDLWAANEALLAAAGVDPERLENARLCTACHPELLYSYRRGHRGRLVTLAALP